MDRAKLDLVRAIYQAGAIWFAPHTLSSGVVFPLYISLRQCVSEPAILKQMAEQLWGVLNPRAFDVICGLPYGAIPLASAMAVQYDQPMLLLRKERKAYAEKSQVDGLIQAHSRCLLLDDFITTGQTMWWAIAVMQSLAVAVPSVATLIDTQLGGVESLEAKGVVVCALFTFQEFCEYLLALDLLSQREWQVVQAARTLTGKLS
jgi:uridine monophosphate synthetase